MLPLWKRRMCKALNNGRPYVIHINMKKGAKNQDQLSAYYLARLLDAELAKLFQESYHTSEETYEQIQNCCRIAELNFSQVDMDGFVSELEKQDWQLDYIYLDRRNNLYEYKLELVEEVASSDKV